MSISVHHVLRDGDRELFLKEATKARSGKQAYQRMARRIRETLEECYAFDLTHMACEIACLGLEQGVLSAEDLLLLAKNHVPIGDVLKRNFEWAVFGDPDKDGEDDDGDDCPPAHMPACYNSAVYLFVLQTLCNFGDTLFSSFWQNCRLLTDYYKTRGTRRKATLELMGMEPEDVWSPYRHRRDQNESGGRDDAEAAVDYEWDLLGDPDFVEVMSLAVVHAKGRDLTRWTAVLSVEPKKATVTILKHVADGDKGEVVEQESAAFGSRTSLLASLLLFQMPKWALKSISTEKGSSAPVFGPPERRLHITAIRPHVFTSEWGLIACIPRFYSWKSLRTRATRDFAPLMAAMERNQPRLERSLENVYAYARRIRGELRAAGWRKDHEILARVQSLTGLSEREVYKRLGYKGRGSEGKRRSKQEGKIKRKEKETSKTVPRRTGGRPLPGG